MCSLYKDDDMELNKALAKINTHDEIDELTSEQKRIFLTKVLQMVDIMNQSDGVQRKMQKDSKYVMDRRNLMEPFEKSTKYKFYFEEGGKRVHIRNN